MIGTPCTSIAGRPAVGLNTGYQLQPCPLSAPESRSKSLSITHTLFLAETFLTLIPQLRIPKIQATRGATCPLVSVYCLQYAHVPLHQVLHPIIALPCNELVSATTLAVSNAFSKRCRSSAWTPSSYRTNLQGTCDAAQDSPCRRVLIGLPCSAVSCAHDLKHRQSELIQPQAVIKPSVPRWQSLNDSRQYHNRFVQGADHKGQPMANMIRYAQLDRASFRDDDASSDGIPMWRKGPCMASTVTSVPFANIRKVIWTARQCM